MVFLVFCTFAKNYPYERKIFPRKKTKLKDRSVIFLSKQKCNITLFEVKMMKSFNTCLLSILKDRQFESNYTFD